MLSAFESGFTVIVSIVLALLLQWLLRRIWSPQARKQHNDLIGWQIGFLATSYAVIVAFMLSGVWNGYQDAETNTEIEANSLILLYRIADGFSNANCSQLKSLSRRYAEVMVSEEWPAMMEGQSVEGGKRLLPAMWKLVVHIQPQTAGEQIILTRAITELANLAEHYRVRQYQSRSQLPTVFWLVLLVGGIITVAYTCLLGVESRRIHTLQVGTTALLISLILVAIADIDQPFRGAIHISSGPFQMALQTFSAMP